MQKGRLSRGGQEGPRAEGWRKQTKGKPWRECSDLTSGSGIPRPFKAPASSLRLDWGSQGCSWGPIYYYCLLPGGRGR